MNVAYAHTQQEFNKNLKAWRVVGVVRVVSRQTKRKVTIRLLRLRTIISVFSVKRTVLYGELSSWNVFNYIFYVSELENS